jgi:hypothetical protein
MVVDIKIVVLDVPLFSFYSVFLDFSDLRVARSGWTGRHMTKLICVFLYFSGFRGVTYL